MRFVIRRDRPSIVVAEGRLDLSKYFSTTPLVFAYRGPHGRWFTSVAERYVERVNWTRLPPAESKSATRRDLITGGFIKLRDTVLVEGDRCIWCGMCVSGCPYGAFDYEERREIRVNYDSCVDCGLCNSICPVDAIYMPSMPDDMLADLIKTSPSPLRFICDFAFVDSDVEGVRVKCIASLPKQYLYLAAAKHGEARAYCSRLDKCPLWPAAERWGRGLGREGSEFVVKAPRVNLEPGGRWQTRMLAVAVGMPVGVIKVAEGCTLCTACANVCPTDALEIVGMELRITPALCIGCGICVNKCPEGVMSLSLEPVERPYERVLLFRDEQLRCRQCGKEMPYSKTMASKLSKKLRERGISDDHIYLCDECRLKYI